MALRIKLPGGILKVKTYRELRTSERDRRVPVRKMGQLYLVWRSSRRKAEESASEDGQNLP